MRIRIQHFRSGSRSRVLMTKNWEKITAENKNWCGVAQLVARRLAVRQARVRFSARHYREGLPTELSSDEEMERMATDKCMV